MACLRTITMLKTTLVAACLYIIAAVHACYHGPNSRHGIASISPQHETLESRSYTHLSSKKIAVKNVKVFDGTRILPPSTVFIEGEIISFENTVVDEIVDGDGGVLLPGFFDAHLHPSRMSDLKALSSYGVTTALGMGCWPEPECNPLRKQVGLTDFYNAGVPATSPNSTHAMLFSIPQDLLIHKASDASSFVADRIGNGSDYIKLIAEGNGMSQEEHNALVAKAHEHGLQAMTHIPDYNSLKVAIKSRTNIIQHMPRDKLIDRDMIQDMLRHKQVITPTLSVERAIINYLHAPCYNFSIATKNTKLLYDAGVPILAGTDASHLDIGVTFGLSLHQELELLYQAGLPTVEILRAATSRPAKYFGFTDRGVIEPGRRADLVLIRGDPISNISNTRNVERVWITGIEYAPVAKASERERTAFC